MKFRCIPNETIRMDDKVLGKADTNGTLVVDEQTVMDMFLARMKRAHKYLIVEPTEEKIVEAAITAEPIKTAEKPKKPRAKK